MLANPPRCANTWEAQICLRKTYKYVWTIENTKMLRQYDGNNEGCYIIDD